MNQDCVLLINPFWNPSSFPPTNDYRLAYSPVHPRLDCCLNWFSPVLIIAGAIEIRDGIMFVFYSGLPHIHHVIHYTTTIVELCKLCHSTDEDLWIEMLIVWTSTEKFIVHAM